MRTVKTLCCVAAALLCVSCALLPKEEEPARAPVARAYAAQEFTYATVARGDLSDTRKVNCTYMPVKEQLLSFPLGGELYKDVYVNEGDAVKEGQLLAELEMGGLDTQLEEADGALARLQLAREQAQQRRELARRRDALTGEDSACAVDKELTGLTDALRVQRLRKEELQEAKRQRQLFAGMDGTVTYVRSIKEGSRSVENETLLMLADSASSVFVASTELYAAFVPGQQVTIDSGKRSYPATVTEPGQLGLTPEPPKDGKAKVYFQLDQPSLELEENDSGSLAITLQERKNVLSLPRKAVKSSTDGYLVYVEEAGGIRAMRKVRVGLEAQGRIEIVEGLAEGESVILE